MPERGLWFQILGPLNVERGGEPIALGGPRQRAVLAYLVVNAGTVVRTERLVDEIWGATAPSTGTGPLRTYVSQLRKLLGTSGPHGTVTPLVGRPPGYLLDVTGDRIDADRFEKQFDTARAAFTSGAPDRALPTLDAALALWHDSALGDLASACPALQAEADRLDQLLLSAKELRAELLLATGQHAHATVELGALASANPLRERVWALLMTAQYRSGRQGEALRTYQDARSRIVDELGIDPGPELRDLEQAILRQDPELDWRPPTPPPGGPAPVRQPPDSADDAGPVDHGVRHNLPRSLTSFVGRVAERAKVAEALAESRLVTLCGSGGCGKTRLAVVTALDVLDRFPDGVWFVDLSSVADPGLSSVTDPGLVVRAWAAVVGAETNQPRPLDHLCRSIGDDETLVVLDNCEHLVEAAAEVVEEVLSRCPSVRVLATSREELQLGAELVRRIEALSLPPGRAIGQDQDEVLRSEAVQLFVERGRAALDGFAPTGATLDDVARICLHLDGIPLAIELAAARVGGLPVGDIAARLDDRFGLLDAGRRRATPRQRTLRAAVDWSFDLLTEPERELFVRLGVFVGDFTLTAAERVAGGGHDPLAVVRDLGHLVTKSMVTCVTTREGADRYRLLETMRQYAGTRLDQTPGADEVHRRYAHHYAEVAAEAERHVHGAGACAWLGQIVSELPNLRAAVAWAFSAGDLETGLRLAGSLRWFFARMGLLDEAAGWLDEGLRHRSQLTPELRLHAVTAATFASFMRGDFSRTRELGEEGVATARELNDPHQLAMALIARGGAAVYEGDLARAEECLGEGGRLCERMGDRWGRAWMLTLSAVGSRRAGRRELARRQATESLEIFRDLHDEHGQVLPLVNLALVEHEEERLDDARVAAREAARLAAVLVDRQLQHTAMCVLGRVEQSLGEPRRARELLVRSIRDFPGAHHQHMVAVALEGLAELAEDAGAKAALLTFAGTVRERWQIWLSSRRAAELDDSLDKACRAIGTERFKVEQERGRELDLDEAMRLATLATSHLAVDVPTADLVSGAPLPPKGEL